jgi:hypothetical protein
MKDLTASIRQRLLNISIHSRLSAGVALLLD